MRTRTQHKPLGNDSATDFAQSQQERAQVELQFYDSATVKVERMTRGIRLHAKVNRPGGAGGWVWQEPYKELDPTLAVAKYTFVYITAGNDIVVTGLTDLVSGVNVKACEGFWQANDDIPAKDGDGKYNVPVHPYPSATGTPTGSPGAVKGDLDAVGTDGKPSVKWIYWGQVGCA